MRDESTGRQCSSLKFQLLQCETVGTQRFTRNAVARGFAAAACAVCWWMLRHSNYVLRRKQEANTDSSQDAVEFCTPYCRPHWAFPAKQPEARCHLIAVRKVGAGLTRKHTAPMVHLQEPVQGLCSNSGAHKQHASKHQQIFRRGEVSDSAATTGQSSTHLLATDSVSSSSAGKLIAVHMTVPSS